MFPVFRGIPRSFVRNLVYTLIWNTLIAAVFALLNLLFVPHDRLADIVWANFVSANCIGFLIHVEFLVGDRLYPDIRDKGLALRTVYYSVKWFR